MEAFAVKEPYDLEDFGVMTDHLDENTPSYNLKALFAYCKRIGKAPAELSDKEREQFRTN